MSTANPPITIGLPVYNGSRFLSQAIDSILNQTYRNFRLIISDNGSTDETIAICNKYASYDSRVTIVRNHENRGGAWNYNRVFALAKGQFFKWAADDDILESTFLEHCLGALKANPNAVLAYSNTVIIDESGTFLRHLSYPLDLKSNSAYTRFYNYLDFFSHIENFHCNPIFGLIRTDILKKTPIIGAYPGSDRILLANLALFGPFEKVPQYLFRRRDHTGRPIYTHNTVKAQATWFDPKRSWTFVLPRWRWLWEYLQAVNRAPIQSREKLLCFLLSFRFSRPKQLLRDVWTTVNLRKIND